MSQLGSVGMTNNLHQLGASSILGWEQCWLSVARCHVLPLDLWESSQT